MTDASGGGNTLQGMGGSDTIVGGDGNDTLAGGNDADRLTGDDGADVFRFDNRSYLNASNAVVINGPDRILDFKSGVDKIHISASGYATGLAHDDLVIPFDTCSGVNPDGTGPLPVDNTADNGTDGTFLYNLKTGYLYWNNNGGNPGGLTAIAVLLAWNEDGNAATANTVPVLAVTDLELS
jgi:Ca2+-binding RTX toxin-like protein